MLSGSVAHSRCAPLHSALPSFSLPRVPQERFDPRYGRPAGEIFFWLKERMTRET